MKKFITVLSLIALVITSCSKDDSINEEISNSSGPLLTKLIYTTLDEDQDSYYNSTYNFVYNGNKIERINHDDGYDKFFYSGELLIRVESYNTNDFLEYKDLFVYNSNNQLIDYRFQDVEDDFEDVNLYTYNSNGTISMQNYTSTIGSATVPPIANNLVYYLTNGEISKIESGSLSYIGIHDNKNSPFKNVVGLNNVLVADAFFGDLEFYGANQNYVSLAANANNGQWGTYTYNSNNYPVTAEFVFKNSPTEATVNAKYFYN